jgi:hypothetical protein
VSVPWALLFSALVVLQSVAVPGIGITSEIVLGGALFAGTAWLRREAISRSRLLLFLVSIAALSLSAFVASSGGKAPSLPSLLLLIAIYWWFFVDLPDCTDLSRFRALRLVILLCAVAGIVQFSAQQVIGFRSFIDLLPESLRLEGFNTSNAVRYGLRFLRSNGYFFLEPSIFSQFMAIGILLEVLVFRQRGLVLALMLAGLIVSVSGTGIMLLVVSGVVAALRDRAQFRNLAIFGLLLLLLVAGFAVVDFDGLRLLFLERALEFAVPGSSGHARFVAPVIYVLHQWGDLGALLFGAGPGAAIGLAEDLGLFADAPLLPKLLSEYGLVGTVPMVALIVARLRGAHVAGWYKAMLFTLYWFLGANLLAPLIVLATLLLHASVPKSPGIASDARGLAAGGG